MVSKKLSQAKNYILKSSYLAVVSSFPCFPKSPIKSPNIPLNRGGTWLAALESGLVLMESSPVWPPFPPIDSGPAPDSGSWLFWSSYPPLPSDPWDPWNWDIEDFNIF